MTSADVFSEGGSRHGIWSIDTRSVLSPRKAVALWGIGRVRKAIFGSMFNLVCNTY